MKRHKMRLVILLVSFTLLAFVVLTFVERRSSAIRHSGQLELETKMPDSVRLPGDRIDAAGGDIDHQGDQVNEVAAQQSKLHDSSENHETSPTFESSVISTGPQARSAVEPSREVVSVPSLQKERAFQENDVGSEETELNAPTKVLFAAQRKQVECELEQADGYDREDLLVMYGRSSAAAGRFDISAAAYTMFLEEFGNDHPYSKRVAMRLANSLAPLDLNDIEISLTCDEPTYHPQWRMGYLPTVEHLEQARVAYELAASLASEDRSAGDALLKLGWVHRALGAWQASTTAWYRCATECVGTPAAQKATILAAQNLEWTGQAAEAAGRLRLLESESAMLRVENLEAESRRTSEWLIDPVASLQAEITERALRRPSHEVFLSAVRWLQRSEERAALIDICRWACTQDTWPINTQIATKARFVDALLAGSAISDAERIEAADALGQIAAIAPDGEGAIPSMRRQVQLLREVGWYEKADRVFERIESQSVGSLKWEPVVMGDKISLLLSQGDEDAAGGLYEKLKDSFPESGIVEKFESVFANRVMEGMK